MFCSADNHNINEIPCPTGPPGWQMGMRYAPHIVSQGSNPWAYPVLVQGTIQAPGVYLCTSTVQHLID